MKRELKRRRWIVRRKLEGWNNYKIASHLRISERTVIRWWKMYQYGDWGYLQIKSRKPNTIHKTPKNIVGKVISLRKEFNWGPNKIEGFLKNQGIQIGHNTIHREICKAGLNNPIDKPRKTWGNTRFERSHSNSLWQTDFKLIENDFYMLSFLDDHARFIVGFRDKIWEATTECVIRLLERSIQRFGLPEQILSDQGSQFFCTEKEGKKHGISQFTQFCIDQGIKHIVASKRRPTTIGKIEAFHKAYEAEFHLFGTLRKFVNYWNYRRPHQSLGYKYPAEIYFRDME